MTSAEAILSPGARRAAECPHHVNVGAAPIFNGGLQDAIDTCLEALQLRRGLRVATANLDFLALARHNPQLREDLGNSHLVVADGMPVARLARLVGAGAVSRVAGVDLVASLCEAGASSGLRIALYGSTPDIAAEARVEFEARFPGVTVSSVITPPFRPLTPAEEAADALAIKEARPDVVLVALGCPAQERFIARNFEALPGAIWIGVGGTLDFFAGRRKRAPRLAQRFGMEWFVRFAQEPRRLGRRYFLRDFPELARLAPACAVARLRR